jgi:hypothetical protein
VKMPVKPVAKPVAKPAAKGGTPLPPGAHRVPGARQIEAEKGAPIREPKTLDPRHHHSPSGGPEVRIPHGVRKAGDKPPTKR